ncbi:MAG: DUF3325 domain-containing protein [Sulfurovum sp.]|nr:DUF3325 domain-containing protein [Sulfurovum sp.]
MSIFISGIILLGLFFLSLILSYPYKRLFGVKPSGKYTVYLHLLGWGMLVVGMILSIKTYGVGIGITYWFGYITLMAFLLVIGLSYKTKKEKKC